MMGLARNLPGAVHVPDGARGALPDFLIIGAQRGGTTSLYSYLTQHPGIAPAREKEPFFFDRHYTRGEAWYRGQFLPEDEMGSRITGEGSTTYLFVSRVPAKVWRMLPDARLIVLLRDPVERAYSSYLMIRDAIGAETLSFEQALAQEEARIAPGRTRMAADDEAFDHDFTRYAYLYQGLYAQHLKAWWEHFPREQMLILQSERLYAAPQETTAQALAFLGLRLTPDLARRIDFHPRFASRGKEPLSARMRAMLAEYYRPHNRALYDLLGVDYGWQ